MTTELYLTPKEVKFLIPSLECILSGVAAKRTGRYFVVLSPFAPPVYPTRTFDEELLNNILSCRNKLKGTGRSGRLRLNAFELAALAIAFRTARKEAKATAAIKPSALNRLARKLEICRKRAKRFWIRKKGRASFTEGSKRWKQLVAWLRFDILAPVQRRQSLRSLSMVAKERRDFMRNVAREVTAAEADATRIQHLADLARREVQRGRHPFIMRELLKDSLKAREYMVNFILDREGPEAIKLEFLPKAIRMSKLAKAFNASLTANLSAAKLHSQLVEWIKRVVDPGYYDDVRLETQYQLGFADLHRMGTAAKTNKSAIDACKPEYTYDDNDLCSYWSVWAARWLLALEPDEQKVFAIVVPAFQEARTWWNKLTPLDRRRKLNQIVARYPSEDPNSRRIHPFAA